MIWVGKSAQFFESNQENINSTSFTKCQTGQSGKMNIADLFLKYAMRGLDIFGQHMTQRIYENYLGILGMTKI